MVMTEALNNYAFSSSVDIEVDSIAPNSEISVDWASLHTDFLGDAVDPMNDIDMITLVMWNLTEAEFQQKLNDDALASSDALAFSVVQTENEITTASLFDFTGVDGYPIEKEVLLAFFDPEVHDPEAHMYTVMAEEGTKLGKGTQMLKGFKIDPESENTEVVIDDESMSLTFEVDLQTLAPTVLPAGVPDITVNWSDLELNAMGREFLPGNIEEVLVARYSESPEELEGDNFLKLREIATDLYTGPVEVGRSMSLASLENEDGEAFGGIDEDGTWILGLVCTRCANPAPWYLTILEPCSGE